jgi:hypothetical protein
MTRSAMDRFYEFADSLFFVRAYDAFYVAGAPIGGEIAFYDRLAAETGGGRRDSWRYTEIGPIDTATAESKCPAMSAAGGS